MHFDLPTCFGPQRRAFFRHPNFQKWPEPEPLMLLTFWLANMCFAPQRRAIFRHPVVHDCQVFNILASKCASRHRGVQVFISHLTRWLRTRRFSGPTFRPSRPTKHWKNTAFRDFPNISRTCIFFLLALFLSLFYFFLLLFSFLLLIYPYCRKFDV